MYIVFEYVLKLFFRFFTSRRLSWYLRFLSQIELYEAVWSFDLNGLLVAVHLFYDIIGDGYQKLLVTLLYFKKSLRGSIVHALNHTNVAVNVIYQGKADNFVKVELVSGQFR